MTIKQLGGVFGRNPTFNNVTIEGTLTFDGDIDINSDLTIEDNLYVLGSVGIGTSSPTEKLQIEGNARLADAGSIQFGSSKYQTLTGTAGSNDLLYRTYANHIFKTSTGATDNTDGTERMRIDASGNLGIGTTTPATGLHLSGANNVSSSLTLTNTAPTPDNTWTFVPQYNALDLAVLNNGAERMRIDASGHAIIPAGVTLGTAAGVYDAAKTLDDYEEGVWIPTLYYQNATGVTRTYTEQTGHYTKIGNTVTVWCTLKGGTSNSGSYANDNIGISGLPFSVIGGNATAPVRQSGFAGTASVGTLCMLLTSSVALLSTPEDANNLADDLGAGATYTLTFSGSYETTE